MLILAYFRIEYNTSRFRTQNAHNMPIFVFSCIKILRPSRKVSLEHLRLRILHDVSVSLISDLLRLRAATATVYIEQQIASKQSMINFLILGISTADDAIRPP